MVRLSFVQLEVLPQLLRQHLAQNFRALFGGPSPGNPKVESKR